MTRIGVIAGTPVDTQMGVDFLAGKGIEGVGYQTAASPQEQHELQLLVKDKLHKIVVEIILEAKEEGIEKFFLYCNSLSSAVDMDRVSRETEAFIVTPFTVYRGMANNYSKLLILAANGQSCAKIETILLEANRELKMWSISALPLVKEIEDKNSDDEIFSKLALDKLLSWAQMNSFDGILLGCTHFPYMKDILEKHTEIPIIDPAEMMVESLINRE